MEIEFERYHDRIGYLKQHMILWQGPRAPGTLIIYVPTVARMDLRVGFILAVHSGAVDVLWNPWRSGVRFNDGELRQLMGIPNSEQRRRKRKGRKRTTSVSPGGTMVD